MNEPVLPERCAKHIRKIDEIDLRVTHLEHVCEKLEMLPDKVTTIATVLKVQTAILGCIGVAIVNKIMEVI